VKSKQALQMAEALQQKIKQVGQCTVMVKTNPKIGELDRHPLPHRCSRAVFADDHCATHSAAYKEQKELQRNKNNTTFYKPSEEEIAYAIKNLIDLGYTVAKTIK